MDVKHKCAVPDCTGPTKAGQLMCLGHWKGLPAAVQRKVNTTWRRYRYEPQEYLEARREAIATARASDADQRQLL